MRALLTVLFMPFLIALGHDLYINYYVDKEKLKDLKMLKPNINDFLVSDLGWIWKEYAPTSMEIVHDSMATSTWENIFNPVLQMPTMHVMLTPFLIVFIINIIMKVSRGEQVINFQIRGSKGPKDNYAVYKHAQEKSMKFKRKN